LSPDERRSARQLAAPPRGKASRGLSAQKSVSVLRPQRGQLPSRAERADGALQLGRGLGALLGILRAGRRGAGCRRRLAPEALQIRRRAAASVLKLQCAYLLLLLFAQPRELPPGPDSSDGRLNLRGSHALHFCQEELLLQPGSILPSRT